MAASLGWTPLSKPCPKALLEIIKEILDNAKLNNGKLTLGLFPMSVEKGVRSAMSMLEDRASEKGNILRATYPEQVRLSTLECDPNR